jgi:hypothetical protein
MHDKDLIALPTDWREMHIPGGVARTVTEAMVLVARRAAQKAMEPAPPPRVNDEGLNGSAVFTPQGIPWPHIARLLRIMVPWVQKQSPTIRHWSREADTFYPSITAAHVRYAYDELARVVTEPAQMELASALQKVPTVAREKAQGVMALWMHLIASAKAHVMAIPTPGLVDIGGGQRQLVVQIAGLMQPVSEAQAVQWQMEKQAVAQLREMLIYEATILSYRLTGLDWRPTPKTEPAPAPAQEKAS